MVATEPKRDVPYKCLRCGTVLATLRPDGSLALGAAVVRQRIKVACGRCGAKRNFRPPALDGHQ